MKELSYDEAMKQLTDIVTRIEKGDVDVDELAASVKTAANLVRACRKKLRTTEEAVNNAMKDLDTPPPPDKPVELLDFAPFPSNEDPYGED